MTYEEQRAARRRQSEDDMAFRRGANEADKQLRRYIASLPPEQRRRAQAEASAQEDQPAGQQVQPGVQGMFNDHGFSHSLSGYNTAMNHAAGQGAHLQGMANQVMSAINAENQSRVAQMREQRRMEHEKELERMRNEAILKRLEAESRVRTQGMMGFQHNPRTGTWDRW